MKISWYRCPIESARLKELTKKSNAKGFLQSVGHLALSAATGIITILLFERHEWAAFAVALWIHGTIYSFIPGLVTHELSHRTVFRTAWINDAFLRIYSLLGWVNFHHYRRSHTFHHMYTLFPEGDREVELPVNPTLRVLQLAGLFTFDFRIFANVVGGTIALAFAGRFRGFFKHEWSDAIFPEEDRKGRRTAVNWARLVLLFHAAVLAISAVTHVWMLVVVVSLGTFVAGWWKYFIGMTMHSGLRDNVADFRKCARTIKLDPFSRFLYWHMNFHAEHHMYGAVPCYNLGKLSREIAFDMPKPRSLLDAWREMRYVYTRQKSEPDYQWDTPVPGIPDAPDGDRFEEEGDSSLRSSIGDLDDR